MPSTSSHAFVRRNVALPGMLQETIESRMAEFGYDAFSPFAIELICFDLRKRRYHLITQPFSEDNPSVQEALDRELVRQYSPGRERRGLLMQALFCDTAETGRAQIRGSFSLFRRRIQCPEVLQPCIEVRWRELGYRNFSAYVTGLIRYDLLLLGPHDYFNSEDTAPDVLAALNAETVRTFEANKPQPLYLDFLIDTAAGRRLTDEERSGVMRRIAAKLREMAMKPRATAGT